MNGYDCAYVIARFRYFNNDLACFRGFLGLSDDGGVHDFPNRNGL